MGMAATLKETQSLVFGDGTRYVTVAEIDFRRKTVKLIAEGPEFIRVEKGPISESSDVTNTKN